MLEHERAGLPPLLDFKYETLLDARSFERSVNYALLRITEIDGHCWDDCVDLTNLRSLLSIHAPAMAPGSAASSATLKSEWRCARAIRFIS